MKCQQLTKIYNGWRGIRTLAHFSTSGLKPGSLDHSDIQPETFNKQQKNKKKTDNGAIRTAEIQHKRWYFILIRYADVVLVVWSYKLTLIKSNPATASQGLEDLLTRASLGWG